MKFIKCGCGENIYVEDEDYPKLAPFNWYCNDGTAIRGYVDGEKVNITSLIVETPIGFLVDHKNLVMHNCLRNNLRLATKQQNNHNCGPRKQNITGYKGVHWRKDKHKFQARIQADKKNHLLGYFNSAQEAALAYNKAAKRLHGEFAFLNIV